MEYADFFVFSIKIFIDKRPKIVYNINIYFMRMNIFIRSEMYGRR